MTLWLWQRWVTCTTQHKSLSNSSRHSIKILNISPWPTSKTPQSFSRVGKVSKAQINLTDRFIRSMWRITFGNVSQTSDKTVTIMPVSQSVKESTLPVALTRLATVVSALWKFWTSLRLLYFSAKNGRLFNLPRSVQETGSCSHRYQKLNYWLQAVTIVQILDQPTSSTLRMRQLKRSSPIKRSLILIAKLQDTWRTQVLLWESSSTPTAALKKINWFVSVVMTTSSQF